MPRSSKKIRSPHQWSIVQSKLLAVVEQESDRKVGPMQICELAGYGVWAWERATRDPLFVARLRKLGVSGLPAVRGSVPKYAPHLEVSLAADPREEYANDLWDMRRLLHDYPRHRQPADFMLDFTWIKNAELREQLKLFYRQRLARWKAGTFRCHLTAVKPILLRLPPEVHLGNIQRAHIEAILPFLVQRSPRSMNGGLRRLRTFLTYAANAPAWTGPRPPRNLIWDDDLPSSPQTYPRPLPPDVLEQLEALLAQAISAMEAGKAPDILTPMAWDAVLILRRTGMRLADLAHLRVPDANGRNGCLVQDSDEYWWVAISHRFTKTGSDHRIPTRQSDGVIAAIKRQQERIRTIPDHFNEHYLFRTESGVLTHGAFTRVLQTKLASHLLHDGKPYRLTGHQFRHTIASEMIDQGVDIYTVKEFLGHKSLQMTERYVKVYLKTLKAKYDAYRLKSQQASASEMMVAQAQVSQAPGDADGGWMEGRVGKLYISPLPDGIGNCAHLPMHDGCPDSPHCPTCPKLRANKRHLPVWESKATNLLITVEALRATPAYARARQKHEQELAHAEKVIKTIKEEGFWDGRIHNNTRQSH